MSHHEALVLKVEELERRVEQLEILLEEARVLASAERMAADAMEGRLTAWIKGGMTWAARA